MPPHVIPCPHCAKPSQIDVARLPEQPVFFPCPHCNGRVVVDRRKLGDPPQPPAVAPPAPPREAASPPLADAGTIAPPAVEPTVPDRRFVKVPADAIFPSGIIVGEDDAAIGEVREALAALGSEVEHVESAAAAGQTIVNEQPDLCIYVAGRIEGVPHAAMAPLTGLHPSFRRRVYIVLVADNLKTFDGNAAFMHEVNMVLGKRDLPRIGAALYSGLQYHERLYRTYLDACESKGAI